jgi:hypothetical protein
VVYFGRCLFGVLCSVLLASSGSALETAEEVQACVKQNLPQKTSVQEVVMRTFDRVGGERSFEAKIYCLALERPEATDMFSYLPEVGRVRRIHPRTMSGSLFGTDFTYEDFQRIQEFGVQAKLKRLPDADLDGRPVYVVESHPLESAESGYERIVSFVDQETCVALKSEFFETGAQPRRRLLADPATLSKEGESWIARTVTMKDLKDGGETRIEVKDIQPDVDIPDRNFSQSRLSRRR